MTLHEIPLFSSWFVTLPVVLVDGALIAFLMRATDGFKTDRDDIIRSAFFSVPAWLAGWLFLHLLSWFFNGLPFYRVVFYGYYGLTVLLVVGSLVTAFIFYDVAKRCRYMIMNLLRPGWDKQLFLPGRNRLRRTGLDYKTEDRRRKAHEKNCLAAVDAVSSQKKLKKIAQTADSFTVRKKAVSKITDKEILSRIYSEDGFNKTVVCALFQVTTLVQAVKEMTRTDMLSDVIFKSSDTKAGVAAVSKLPGDFDFGRIIQKSRDTDVARAALNRCSDMSVIKKTVLQGVSELRLDALALCRDEALLEEIAIQSKDRIIGEEAVNRIKDIERLMAIVLKSDDYMIQRAALENVKDNSIVRSIILDGRYSSYIRSCALDRFDEDPGVLAETLDATGDETIMMDCYIKLGLEEIRARDLLERFIDFSKAWYQSGKNNPDSFPAHRIIKELGWKADRTYRTEKKSCEICNGTGREPYMDHNDRCSTCGGKGYSTRTVLDTFILDTGEEQIRII